MNDNLTHIRSSVDGSEVWEWISSQATRLQSTGEPVLSPVMGIRNWIVAVTADEIVRRSESPRTEVGESAVSRSQIIRMWDRLRAGEHVKETRFAMALLLLLDEVELVEGSLVLRAARPTRRYWSFLANPRRYRIEDAIAELTLDTWITRGKEIRAGDRGLIWRAAGSDGRRGLIALVDILSDPSEQKAGDSAYWTDEPISDHRVIVRYLTPSALPMWIGGPDDDLLSQLAVSRARGGTVFEVDADTWAEVLGRIGGWPAAEAPEVEQARKAVSSKHPLGKGQGFQLDQASKAAVEAHAMARAALWLEREGWTEVENTSRNRPYDLVGHRGSSELRVEVKGTLGDGRSVLVTPNEVAHARSNQVALFVLHHVQIGRRTDGVVEASGGLETIYEPLAIEDSQLTALGYSLSLPISPVD